MPKMRRLFTVRKNLNYYQHTPICYCFSYFFLNVLATGKENQFIIRHFTTNRGVIYSPMELPEQLERNSGIRIERN